MKEWISDDRRMDVIITKRERGGQRNAANINLNLFSRDGTSGSRRGTPPHALFIPHGLCRKRICISPPLAHVTDLL